jgi:hypothetical protein
MSDSNSEMTKSREVDGALDNSKPGFGNKETGPSLFRTENIRALYEAISQDEYDDTAQEETRTELGQQYAPDALIEFTQRNLKSPWLEVGPGSGSYLAGRGIIADRFLEPSFSRLQTLRRRLVNGSPGLSVREVEQVVVHGVLECIPSVLFEGLSGFFSNCGKDGFNAIVFLNGFFQVRSDYECLIEVNRALNLGGHFIFNLSVDDTEDAICGRVLGVNNYVRVMREFGFDTVEVRSNGFMCFKKVKEFDPRDLRKLQLAAGEDGQYRALNFFPDGRDRSLV